MFTDLGEIKIFINEIEVSYDCIELINYSRFFSVKKRFKLVCEIPKSLMIVAKTHIMSRTRQL